MNNCKIDLENFVREIKIRKLLEEQNKSTYTDEFPLSEIKALSVDALRQEIKKLSLIYNKGVQ